MNRFHLLSAAVLGVAFALGATSSHAQPAPEQTTAPAPENATIKVRNMTANLLAYWLDPAHNPLPIPVRASQGNGGFWTSDVAKMTRQPGNGNGPRGLKMPDGIESIVAIDPQNVLQVKGTAEGIEALRALVREIDAPMGQIEVEAQIWEVAPAEFAQLPLGFRNVSRSTAPFDDTTFGELAFAPLDDDISDVARQLNHWRNSERARLITATRVTAIDGLATALTTTETRAFDVNAMKEVKPEPPEPAAPEEAEETTETATAQILTPQEEKPDDSWELGKTRIQSQIAFSAMPVLHGDLIALATEIVFDNGVTTASTIMRDGQTLPVRLAGARTETGWVRLVLIRPRIIYRAGDGAKTPAAKDN